MKTIRTLGLSLLCALGASPALATDAPVLQIKNFIGTIDIKTGGTDKPRLTPAKGVAISKTNTGWLVDGGQNMRRARCKTRSDKIRISLKRGSVLKRKYKNINTFPHLVMQIPAGMQLDMSQSITSGRLGDFSTARLDLSKCNILTLGRVGETFALDTSGANDVSLKKAGRVRVDTSGASDLAIDEISGSVNIQTSGASDIELGHIGGDLDFETSGASDLTVAYVGGTRLDLSLSGASDIKIDDGNVDELVIESSGASDVRYGGQSRNANIDAHGVSDITITKPSGHLYKEKSGLADITIR